MSTLRLRITLPLVVLLVSPACKTHNPYFCEGAPRNNCLAVDAGGGQACSNTSECSGATPVCDVTGSGTCVECTPAEDDACTGTKPACVSNTCQGCTEHAQCTASNACLPDGSCADTGQVAYVQEGGSGTACTKAMPCGTLDNGVNANKPYVKIAAGLVKDTKTTTIMARVVTILADRGAKLDRDGDGVVLEVRNTGADVQIYDLEISGASGGAGDVGISMPAGGTPKLALTRVTVTNNVGGGISSSGGSLTVAQSTIFGNQGGGISSSGGTLTVTRSTISTNNPGGGILMSGNGVVSLTNNFIHHNGDTIMASAGGVSLRPMGASKVEFNTIVDNQANLGAASAGGVFCDQAGFVAANNLIFRNTGGAAGNAQTFGNCTYGNSFNMPGASAVDNSVGFVSPNVQPLDYHLGATSPPSVVNAAGGCTGVDFDGQMRPSGSACDLGADERVP